ncbi:hydroxyethylthiazole kinase [Sulfurospirillum barnesii]|uniref:Hydroxyethylthiazole kinase n=1 Tax=Sulfurospirillum barnesii (strain ATCC 700032 / DSM 10660 / SES-3) TaxID=760154 RepID=I3XWR3_SULBS|nr:hydroxyethylthiazole kinase [Sulfurospirillum barnesii]AFL68387.1 hydroxyethylthiazole kinase [Sulfurospirillum barnesii SES-3]
MDIKTHIHEAFAALENTTPLIHHITNYVTVNECANVVLAIGASPIMASEISEVAQMVGFAQALVLNIGTANTQSIEAMLEAGRAANAQGIPVVLDPVGVGATTFRRQSVARLLEQIRFSVIRGNMAEMKTLAGLETKSSGVDSLEDESDALSIAQGLAKKLNCVIAITGKEDVVCDGTHAYTLCNGDEALRSVTGTGCMSSSLIGSFLGATNNPLLSAILGISTMSLAGELADKSKGMGTFRISLFDRISKMNASLVLEKARIYLKG